MTTKLATAGLVALAQALRDFIERQKDAERLAQVVGHPVEPKNAIDFSFNPNPPVGAGE